MKLSLLDRILGRDVDAAARDYLAAMRPAEQVEEGFADVLAALAEARTRKTEVSGRKYTPPVQPRPVIRTAVPKDA